MSSTESAAGGGGQASPPGRGPAGSADAVAEPPHSGPGSGGLNPGGPKSGGPKSGGPEPDDPEPDDPEPRAERGPHDVPWFLREGRAALAPESVTIDPATASADISVDVQAIVDIAGAPPWAAEPAAQEPDEPPPWESGPWPSRGPGGEGSLPGRGGRDRADPALPPSRRVESRPAQPGDWPADGRGSGYDSPNSSNGSAPARYVAGGRDAAGSAGSDGNSLATAALIAGIAGILVVPGIVLGVLGLRRAKVSGTGQAQSWLGIGLSLVWALGIIIIVVSLQGQSSSADSGCSAYQASGQAAVARVTAALKTGAPEHEVRADLRQAASAVNSASAQAQDLGVRSALSALTGDLQEGLREVSPAQGVPSTLGTTLSGDSARLTTVCH
jgi:hypothetical protein